jgi:glycosyltransferase involved in cell wall biosynthesis
MSIQDKILVTIGIPFYNAEKFLEKAILSVFNQSIKEWVLILMDDGSTDSSLIIAKKYENDYRVKVISDGYNRNLANRLNELIDLCETKYFTRMDADDIMHPERIRVQIEILEKNQKIDILGTNAYSIDEKDNIQGIKIKIDLERSKLIPTSSFIHPTIMGKTCWFKKNYYDPKAVRVEDYELWNRTKKSSNFMLYTQPLLFYREYTDKYYKKYFIGINSVVYVALKLKKIHLYITILLHSIKGIIYYIANKVGIENKLIKYRYYFMNKCEYKKAIEELKNSIKKQID